jgi:hypothetical protein
MVGRCLRRWGCARAGEGGAVVDGSDAAGNKKARHGPAFDARTEMKCRG